MLDYVGLTQTNGKDKKAMNNERCLYKYRARNRSAPYISEFSKDF